MNWKLVSAHNLFSHRRNLCRFCITNCTGYRLLTCRSALFGASNAKERCCLIHWHVGPHQSNSGLLWGFDKIKNHD